MAPEITTLRRRAFGQAIIIALLALLDLRIILNIIAGQLYPGVARLAPFWALMLAMVVGVSVHLEIMNWRMDRSLRAALSGDMSAIPPAQSQPAPTLALQPGETLTLTRVTQPGAFWRQLLLVVCLAPVGLVMFAYMGEYYLYLAAPSAFGWLAPFLADPNPTALPAPPTDLSLLQWAAFLPPLVLAALAAGTMWLTPFSGRRQDIIASDAGLTIRQALRRRSIAWSDILLILRSDLPDSSGVAYWLYGRQPGATIDIRVIVPSVAPNGKPRRSTFAYSGGLAAYLAGVDRLAATLTVRAHTPLRQWEPSPASATGQPVVVYDDVRSLEQALALPLADAYLQPTPAEMEQARAFTGKRLTLYDRVPFRALAPQIRKHVIVLELMMAFLCAIALLEAGLRRGSVLPLTMSIALYVVGMLALGAALAVFLTAVAYRDEVSPAVAATRDGLALMKFNDQPRQRIAWGDIRAWAILAPAPGQTDPAGCVIWTEEQTLQWAEPPNAQLAGRGVHGDRREAYRATARRLHALIAARTGLSPRTIQPRVEA